MKFTSIKVTLFLLCSVLLFSCTSSKKNGDGGDTLIFTEYASYNSSVFALDSNGLLYAWGKNNVGQLGVGGIDNKTSPTLVALPTGRTLTSFDNFTTNGNFAFAFLDDGSLYAWGNNDYGQLGVGDSINKNSPTLVALPVGTALTSFNNFTINNGSAFAILDNGSLYAWGKNNLGQLGVGDSLDINSPTPVALPTGRTLTSFDNFTIQNSSAFAFLDDGLLYAWGDNYFGQLGVGVEGNKSSPTLVSLPTGRTLQSFDNFTTVGNSTFAFLDDGLLYAWGNNYYGQLGIGDSINKDSPTLVALPVGRTLQSFDNFNINGYSAFAFLDDGSLYAWGYNDYGQLGVGDSINKNSPTLVALPVGTALTSFDNFTTNGGSAFAFLDDGLLYAWGYNTFSQLGVGDSADKVSPTLVTLPVDRTLQSFDNFTINDGSAFAFLDDGSLYAWGNNYYGQLGVGDSINRNSPTLVALPVGTALTSFDNFTINYGSAFAFLDDGSLYAWGYNEFSLLGVGDSINRNSPTLVALPVGTALTSFDNFTINYGSAFALLDDGLLYAWGDNYFGQLGVGVEGNKSSPTLVGLQ